MDIICPICGEPWEHDMLHESGLPYEEAWKWFRRVGCELFGARHGEEKDEGGALAARAAYGLMPDDPDGCAAFFEDLGRVR